MTKKIHRFLLSFIVALFALISFQSSLYLQTKPDDIANKYPEIEGIYELKIQDVATVEFQIYFKDGMLRTLEEDGDLTVWDFVPERELQFTITSKRDGAFFLTFLKDEQGKFTRFHVVNENVKLDAYGVKKAAFDDKKANPASRRDRLGYFERHYHKSEHQIPMRDGIRLFTQIFSPLGSSELYPIILVRTPYGIKPYGERFPHETFPSLLFAKENYILVYQDIRGRSMSEGKFNDLAPYIRDKKSSSDVDESSDAYDTVEWLLKNVPNHNGKVGVWGSSYLGFTAAMAAIDAHPAVRAVSPQAPVGDTFLGDDGHHYGAFYLAHYASFVYSVWRNREEPAPFWWQYIQYGTPDGYAFFLELGTLKNISAKIFREENKLWNDAMAHETYDSYWKSRSIYKHLRRIKPAILTVGGWYDAEDLLGTLKTYKAIEKQNPGLQNTLVMGPWRHSGWNMIQRWDENMGVFSFSGTRAYFQEKIELPFFNYYLKGRGTLDLHEAHVFDTGTNQWESYDIWPPVQAKEKKLYFADKSRLLFKGDSSKPKTSFDEYLSDPAKPVPYTLQPSLQPGPSYNMDYFVEDQRFAASRPDVLVYVSEPLPEDIKVAGPITAELYVSTTGTDADWVVKVIDVFPGDAPDPKDNPQNVRMGGYQRLIRGDVIRGKFRNSFEKPEPFIPGQVTEVKFELPDILHTFLKGHRIMVQVQSSWFPLIDRNPQKFCNIRQANEEDFQKATHRVFRAPQYPSGIHLRVLPKE